MTVSSFQPVSFYDLTVADLYTRTAQQNPHYDLVHLITENVEEDRRLEDVRYTWREVMQHAHNAARDLRTRAGVLAARAAGEELFVVGMLGINGYDYYMNLLGCVLNRWTVLLISPKNSAEGIQHLLKEANASLLLIDHLGATLIPTIVSTSVLYFSSHKVYTSGETPAPFIRFLTPEETAKEYDLAVFYLHTSGSTGHPKLIPWTHRLVLSGPRLRMRERPIEMPRPYLSIPPLSHAMGMFSHILFPPARPDVYLFIQSSLPNAIPRPASAATILQLLPYLKGGTVALPPSILEELWEMGDEAIESVAKTIWMIIFAGAALKHSIGDGLVQKGVPLVAAYGATEILPGSKMVHPEDWNDWEYVQWREGYEWHMLPTGEDADSYNLRELVVGPAEDTPAVLNHTDPLGYATNDIWEAHPTKKGLWRHHSRKGNVTVLSNGEKTDNKQVETLLLENPHVKHVIVFGTGKPLNGVLIDPSNPNIPSSEFLSLIVPTIRKANSILPTHSLLVPELILVTFPNKPLSLTDKGTVRNGESLERYKVEIEHAYEVLEGTSGAVNVPGIGENVNEKDEDIRGEIRSLVHAVLKGKGMGASNEDYEWEDSQVEDEADLFENGLDSLLSIRLRSGIVSLLNRNRISTHTSIPRNVVYTYPTISALVSYVEKLMAGSLEERQSVDGDELSNHANGSSRDNRTILEMIEKYSTDFEKHDLTGKWRNEEGLIIAMTGSTGTVGCTLLRLILLHQSPVVKHIYILNRPSSITHRERLINAMQERGIDPCILVESERKGKISYLDVDLSRSDLGLSKEDYEKLRVSITHLIHCAWHLNFNLVLNSYERVHVAGVRNLIALCLSSSFSIPPRFVFASSIAAVAAYSPSEPSLLPLIPESPISDPSAALPHGYGQSKFVSEQIITRAVREAGLQATIVRIGQLTGASGTGVWNRHEHIPILMRSALELGAVPTDLFETVRWTPSDVASAAFLSLILASQKALEYFHIDNPIATQWSSIAEAICNYSSPPLQLISSSEWLTRIGQPDIDPKNVPAAVLIEFFRESRKERFGILSLENTRRVTRELDTVGEISTEFVRLCLKYQAHE